MWIRRTYGGIKVKLDSLINFIQPDIAQRNHHLESPDIVFYFWFYFKAAVPFYAAA